MQEIKTTLAELDALLGDATRGEWYLTKEGTERHGIWSRLFKTSGPMVSSYFERNRENAALIVSLHNAYPTLRAHIERLERIEAAYVECGGQLTEQGEPNLTHLTRVAEAGRVLAEAVEKMGPRHVFSAGGWPSEDDEHYRELRNAALSAYHTATQDIKSKE